jgi:hypothetical protein
LPATGASIRAPSGGHGAIENLSLTSDRGGGLPRGFGFLVRTRAYAAPATQALNGTDVDRCTLTVKAAQERPDRRLRSGPQGR